MKFEVGDLVRITSNSPLFGVVKSQSIGIVSKHARLMYVHDWEDEDILKEFWAYDIIIEGQTFENVPEEGLRGISNDNEKDFK